MPRSVTRVWKLLDILRRTHAAEMSALRGRSREFVPRPTKIQGVQRDVCLIFWVVWMRVLRDSKVRQAIVAVC